MRYFTSVVILKEDERHVDEDEYEVLYEELDNKCAAFIRNTYGYRRRDFTVDIVAYNSPMTIDDARDLTKSALEIWGLSEKVEGFTCKHLEKLCDGNRSLYKKVSDLVPMSETYLFTMRYKSSFASYVFLPKKQKDCREMVENCPWKKSVSAEIKRIFDKECAPANLEDKLGFRHPFHYIFNGTANPKFKDTLSALVSARLQAGSLISPNVMMFDLDALCRESGSHFDDGRSTYDLINESLGESLRGNTVVLKYGLHDQNSSYDGDAYKFLNRFIDILTPHLDETLVVFAIPNLNPELELNIARHFDYPLVPLTYGVSKLSGTPTKAQAKRAFKEFAKEDGVEIDNDLIEQFDDAIESQNFVSCEATYTRWKVSKRITEKFPTYDFALEKFNEIKKQQTANTTEQLESLVGLKTVKAEIRKVLACAKMEEVGNTLGVKSPEKSLHLAFTGNPGTGKTEVARLYGQILNEAHILSEGRVISVNGADLFSSVEVEAAFRFAAGSVLFIDEAYAIPNMNAIASLIANMENMRDEVVVILAGYSRDMEALFKTNAGFKSRIGSVIKFPDYTADELFEIFKFICKKYSITGQDDALALVRETLFRQGRRPDQGNARYVRTLFEKISTEQRVRLASLKESDKDYKYKSDELKIFKLEDVKSALEAMSKDKGSAEAKLTAREELTCLIGLDDVKDYVSEVVDFFKVQKSRLERGLSAESVSMHMAFTGSPGTGKTEVARLMGKILADEGILSIGDLIECGRADLIGPAVGTTAPQIEDLFEKARGSIIFIDEAYSILDSDGKGYGQEAVDTLIAQMENLREEVIVIFAGYDEEIDKLFEANPGFASRVKTRIQFDDYSTPEMVEIFNLMAQKRSLALEEGFDDKLAAIFDNARKKHNFGNGRYVRNLLEETIRKQAKRIVAEMSKREVTDQEMQTLIVDDIRIPDDVIKKNAPRKVIGFAA